MLKEVKNHKELLDLYTAANICPDKNKNSQYVRRIIDIDGMYRDGGKRSVRATSQDIPITLIMRFQSADGQGNDELATNTSYTFQLVLYMKILVMVQQEL